MKGVMVDSIDVRKFRNRGVGHNEAIRLLHKSVEVDENHPAYDSLRTGVICVLSGIMYGLNLKHLLEDAMGL